MVHVNQPPVAGARPPPDASAWELWRWRVTAASWWHWSYLLDYVCIGALIAIAMTVFYSVIEPFHRFLPANDPDVAYPHIDTIVPTWALVLGSLGIPILAFLLYQFWGRSVHDLHHATLGLVEGFAFTVFFTMTLKIYTGEYRPNFLAHGGTQARQSFPSAHASVAMQSGVFLSLWLAGKLGLFKKTGGHVWQQFIVYLPMIAAVVVAFTRTRDYSHNFVDVAAGILLGGALAVWSYMLKYPPLWKRYCEIPKRRWYVPHLSKEEWAARYAYADKHVPPNQLP